MKTTPPKEQSHSALKLQIDECADAYGFITLRLFDGTPNGDTEEQPVATVFKSEHADIIVEAVNSHTRLLAQNEMLRKALKTIIQQTESWNIAVEGIIGRRAHSGIDLQQARAALEQTEEK